MRALCGGGCASWWTPRATPRLRWRVAVGAVCCARNDRAKAVRELIRAGAVALPCTKDHSVWAACRAGRLSVVHALIEAKSPPPRWTEIRQQQDLLFQQTGPRWGWLAGNCAIRPRRLCSGAAASRPRGDPADARGT